MYLYNKRLTLKGTNQIGIGTTYVSASLDLSGRSDAIVLPRGTIDERVPIATCIRYNTDLYCYEYYSSELGWISISMNPVIVSVSGNLMANINDSIIIQGRGFSTQTQWVFVGISNRLYMPKSSYFYNPNMVSLIRPDIFPPEDGPYILQARQQGRITSYYSISSSKNSPVFLTPGGTLAVLRSDVGYGSNIATVTSQYENGTIQNMAITSGNIPNGITSSFETIDNGKKGILSFKGSFPSIIYDDTTYSFEVTATNNDAKIAREIYSFRVLAAPPAGPYIVLIASDINQQNNTKVSSWGRSRLFTQATTANQPTFFNTGGYQNRPYVFFNRTNSEHLAGGNLTLNLQTNSGFTMMGLIKFTGTAGSWERVFDFGNGSANNNLFLGRITTTTNFRFEVYNSTTPSTVDTTSTPIIQDKWIICGVRYNRTATRIEIFVDNNLIAQKSSTIILTDRTITNTYIGRSNWGDAYLNALIDSIYMYDRFLSDTEMTYLYQEIASRSKPYFITASGNLATIWDRSGTYTSIATIQLSDTTGQVCTITIDPDFTTKTGMFFRDNRNNTATIYGKPNDVTSQTIYVFKVSAIDSWNNAIQESYAITVNYAKDGSTSDRAAVKAGDINAINPGNITSGVYWLKPSSWTENPFQVYIDFAKDGGSWVLISKWGGHSKTLDKIFNAYNFDTGTGNLLNSTFSGYANYARLSRAQMIALWKESNYVTRIHFKNDDATAVSGVYFQRKITDRQNFDIWQGHYNTVLWSDGNFIGTTPSFFASPGNPISYKSRFMVANTDPSYVNYLTSVGYNTTFNDFTADSYISGGMGGWDYPVPIYAPGYGNINITRHMGFFADITTGNQWIFTANSNDARFATNENRQTMVFLRQALPPKIAPYFVTSSGTLATIWDRGGNYALNATINVGEPSNYIANITIDSDFTSRTGMYFRDNGNNTAYIYGKPNDLAVGTSQTFFSFNLYLDDNYGSNVATRAFNIVVNYAYDGSSYYRAARSPQDIIRLTNIVKTSADNGLYYLNLPTYGITQVYCIMDNAMNGGGWMLAMKATRGTTFGYDSIHWTTNSILNEGSPNRNDGDAKYYPMNVVKARDVMAIFPDIGANGGSIAGQTYGWTWLENNWNPSTSQRTLIDYFATGQSRYISAPSGFSGFSASYWSTQGGRQWYGFNYTANYYGRMRWGFAWNNEVDDLSNDVYGGIGMTGYLPPNNQNYSAGDFAACCQATTGLNRSMRVELYVRNYPSSPSFSTASGLIGTIWDRGDSYTTIATINVSEPNGYSVSITSDANFTTQSGMYFRDNGNRTATIYGKPNDVVTNTLYTIYVTIDDGWGNIVDTRAFYIRVLFTYDGSDVSRTLTSISALRSALLIAENTRSGPYYVTYNSTSQKAYAMYYNNRNWVLVGKGREYFGFTNAGNSTFTTITDTINTTTAYWMPSDAVQQLMNSTWDAFTLGLFVQRFEVNDTFQYQMQTANTPFDWSLFLSSPATVNARAIRYNSTSWATASISFTTPYDNLWTDTYYGSGNNNNELRCFTWTWGGHANVPGFSAGSTITSGYQAGTEAHAIQRVNVWVPIV